MKTSLIAVALLAVVIEEWAEAYPGWATYPGFQNERGNYPGRSPQPMENQNNGFSSDIEWVCQNPRTNDIMIIASDDTRHTPQHHPGPWWQGHNVQPGHQKKHHQHNNFWSQPSVIVIQETSNTDKSQTPTPTVLTTMEIPDKQTLSPPYHGGEGSIDIRIGAE